MRDPCYPNPCGLFSQCINRNGVPGCSCLPEYTGSPPNCKPECSISQDCLSSQACIRQKCMDPCPGSCGLNAQCNVINHTPICTCFENYIGDPFTSCQPAPPTPVEVVHDDPCNPSPCGSNAQCRDGVCTCLAEYHGDPYSSCRPECVLNSDCSRDKACIRSKCVDPCPGVCAPNAICEVFNHIPMCSCSQGMEGNAFVQCQLGMQGILYFVLKLESILQTFSKHPQSNPNRQTLAIHHRVGPTVNARKEMDSRSAHAFLAIWDTHRLVDRNVYKITNARCARRAPT